MALLAAVQCCCLQLLPLGPLQTTLDGLLLRMQLWSADEALQLSHMGMGTYLGDTSVQTDEAVVDALLYSVTHGWNVIDTGALTGVDWLYVLLQGGGAGLVCRLDLQRGCSEGAMSCPCLANLALPL